MMTQPNVTTNVEFLERKIFTCLIISMQLFLVAGILRLLRSVLFCEWVAMGKDVNSIYTKKFSCKI